MTHPNGEHDGEPTLHHTNGTLDLYRLDHYDGPRWAGRRYRATLDGQEVANLYITDDGKRHGWILTPDGRPTHWAPGQAPGVPMLWAQLKALRDTLTANGTDPLLGL